MIRFALSAGVLALTVAPAFAGDCASCGSAPSYSAPAVTYSQPMQYSQPVQHVEYSQSYVQTSSPCGQAVQQVEYSQPCSSCSTTTTYSQPASTCGSASVAYSQPSYQSSPCSSPCGQVVQTAATDCGCSGTVVQTSGYAPSPCSGQTTYSQPSYGAPMNQSYAPATSNCPNCSSGPVYDGTSSMQSSGTVNYGQSLQQGGVIQPQPLNTTTQPNAPQSDAANEGGSENGRLENLSEDAGPATEAPETPDDIGGDEA